MDLRVRVLRRVLVTYLTGVLEGIGRLIAEAGRNRVFHTIKVKVRVCWLCRSQQVS